jgi:hypothetical protein
MQLHYTNPDGQQVVGQLLDPPPQPLDPTGALATLLAVLEVATVADAANAVGLTPDDLIAEAEAWEAARS